MGNELGFDVSGWQPSINWEATGHSFVYIKATQGTGYVNPWLDEQYGGAVYAGLAVGLYHYANPHNDPRDDARAFSNVVKQYGANASHNLPPCLDFEVFVGDPNAWIYTFFVNLWSDLGGEQPVTLYASASDFADNRIHSDWSPSVALWVASWGRPPGQPSWTSPRVVLHQYTSNGTLPGVGGSVDLDCAVWPLASILIGA